MAASAEAKAETPAERSPRSPLCFQVPSIPYDPNLHCCMQYECVANTEGWLSFLSGLDKLNNYKIYRFIKSTSPGCTQLFWQHVFLNSKSNLKHSLLLYLSSTYMVGKIFLEPSKVVLRYMQSKGDQAAPVKFQLHLLKYISTYGDRNTRNLLHHSKMVIAAGRQQLSHTSGQYFWDKGPRSKCKASWPMRSTSAWRACANSWLSTHGTH